MSDEKEQNQPASEQYNKLKKRYDIAIDTRKFEIDLFWKRSLFFWGFIASAFVAFVAFSGDKTNNFFLKSIVTLFGLVCSFCWTLANRGSKYWQENWESQVEKIEDDITGPMFKKPAQIQKKFWWFRARRFSVGKLTISLSDYITIIWFGLCLHNFCQLPSVKSCWPCQFESYTALFWFFIFTISWLFFILVFTRTTKNK